jgi:hypothetical protein
MANTIKHFGVLGMHWGQHKNSSTSSTKKVGGGRRTSFLPTSQDGRKVDKLLGARNRKKIRNFFLGNPDEFVRNMPILKTKYKEMTPEEKIKTKKIVSPILASLSIISMASLAYMIKHG